jgi:hypothetical protein
MLWVRAGVGGSVGVDVDSYDRESGIARNLAAITGGSGWRVEWVGNSANGSLRLYYSARGSSARLEVSSVNRAGLTGASSVGTLMRDDSSPTGASWASAPAGTTREIHGSYFKLDWTGATDEGSGLATYQVVGRYRAGLKSDGTCKTNGFVPDGGFRLATDHSWDSGLAASSCYVWSIRTLDNVGNLGSAAVSGYVITLPEGKR